MPQPAPMPPAARSWYRANTFSHHDFSLERLAEHRDTTVSVCMPARNEARTIGGILEQLVPLRELGIINQVVIVDHSTDGTSDIARGYGAEVHDQESLLPEHGPVLGKGDAMWRGLTVLTGELVCFLDADSEEFGPHYARGLLGPLLCRPSIEFVKGYYRRPLRVGDQTLPNGGGRVTELTARPLLNLFYPDLAAVAQPLSGELAARR
jgi:glucosyl-3-phosphoglycerate synthase